MKQCEKHRGTATTSESQFLERCQQCLPAATGDRRRPLSWLAS